MTQRCVVCDAEIPTPGTRCTNRCCLSCHSRYCSDGGNTSPGHGLNVAVAKRLYASRAKSEKKVVEL